MKTFRIILSVLAIVVAVGGAVASVRFTPRQKFMYDFIDNPGMYDDLCREVLALCDVSGNIPCTVTSIPRQLRQNANLNATPQPCGPQMWRP